MYCFHHTCITPYSVEQITHLVLDVESYPHFLPWCCDARIVEKNSQNNIHEMVADLYINFKGIGMSYRSQVVSDLQKESSIIDVNAIKGPFNKLHNSWHIVQNKEGVLIDFTLEFALSASLFDKMLAPFFAKACDKMLLSFMKRAEELYAS